MKDLLLMVDLLQELLSNRTIPSLSYLTIAVNSDESLSMGYSSTYTSQFSKSPSSDSSFLLDDRSFWPPQDGLAHLTKEEREAVYNVPAAKNAEDIKLFTRQVVD